VRNVSTSREYAFHVRRSKMMPMKEERDRIVSMMKDWESLEKLSAKSIEEVKAKCGNPLICLIMDIIENDAGVHERLQQFVISSLEKKPIDLSPDEIGEVIALIRKHSQLKDEMIQKTEELLNQLKDKSLSVQKFLLKTIVADEKKHRSMLEAIEEIRKGLYPYWAH
jgi:hypothetical protein